MSTEVKLLIVLGLIFLVYIITSHWWLKKKFNIAEEKRLFVRYVNKAHGIIEFILIVLFIASVSITGKSYWVFLFLGLIYLVRGMMKWKFEKEQKEHILDLNAGISILLFFIVVLSVGIFK